MKRPILYCAISFLLGISFAYFFNIPILYSLISSIVLIFLAIIFVKKNILSHVFLYLALFSFAAAYYQNYIILPQGHIANFALEDGRNVSIKGIVADDPITKKAFYGKEKTSFIVKSNLLIDGSAVQGVTGLAKVDVYSDEKESRVIFGDEVVMEGVLSIPQGLKNPGLFDYSRYLKIKNIYAVFTVNGSDSIKVIANAPGYSAQRWAYIVRHKIRDCITKYVDKPYSGFLKAVLIGDRSELEGSITDDFVKTGTVHVLAISGLHIGLVAAVFLFIFKIFHIPKRYSLILTACVLVFYSFIAGSNPPVIRATIIFVIFVLGYLINRKADILNSLSAAAFLILLGNPKELFDPSFQLSFASVFSIAIFAAKIEEYFKFKPAYIAKGMAVSIAACVGVLPIVARYFNIFSPIAVIANLVIIPALFVIVAASFIFLSLNFLGASFLLVYMGSALSFLIHITFYINHILSKIPLSYIRIPAPPLVFLFLYYAVIFSFFFMKRKKYLFISLLLIINFAVWSKDFNHHNKELKITYLDVGKGDSILVEFPDKGTLLIDGGSGGIEGISDMGKNVIAPYLWNKGIRRLDAVIITHFHEDHMGGILYLLKNFDVGCVMDNDVTPDGDKRLYYEYKKIVTQEGLRRLVIANGDEITGFTGVKLYVLNPPEGQADPDANDSSVVIKLEYGNFSALFCGDISSRAMERLLFYGDLLRSALMGIPHHGGSVGKEAVARKFFKEVSPKVTMTSLGAGFHSRDLSKVIFDVDSINYNTKKNGAITILTDGSNFEVKPFCLNN